MATQVYYTGNGSTTTFNLTFPYESQSDVKVSVNGADVSFTWATLSSVSVSPAPASGAVVRVYRDTSMASRAVDFTDGSVLTETDLDKSNIQVFNKVQEMETQADDLENRAVRVKGGENGFEFPVAATRASTILGFDAAGAFELKDADDFRGLSGPANNTYSTLAAFKASSALTNLSAIFDGSLWFWKSGNYTGLADDKSIVQADGIALTTGAWVRQERLKGAVNVKDFGAVGDGVTDDTAAIQAAINTGFIVYCPPGAYKISAVTGLVVSSGTQLIGAGRGKTALVATLGGGTVSQLASYTQGSIIKRAFNPAGTNAYVTNVYIADLAIILTHPSASITTTAIQIGIDFRNITRSIIERVHVGNLVPVGGPVTKSPASTYDQQGYGVVFGNVSSSDAAYAGGEVNTIRDSDIWGAYKAIVQDDATLSPVSAAHATIVERCDIQGAHFLQSQESQYTAGVVWRGNVLQNVIKKNGDSSSGYVMQFAGYNSILEPSYIEAGSAANYLVRLNASSKNNRVKLTYYTATGPASITDEGTKNLLSYFEDTGSISGGVNCDGPAADLYDKAYGTAWVKFHWNGSAIVIDGGRGATVARNGVGDYTITWTKPFPSAHYALSGIVDTNGSFHGGTMDVASHSASNARIITYSQNGGTTTQIDPGFVWVTALQ